MMLIFGTIPDKDLPVTLGEVRREGNMLIADGKSFSCTQGTGAMISAALAVTKFMKRPPPQVLVAGDIGDGKGTREMFQRLIEKVNDLAPEVLTMHYCLPIMALVKKVCQTIDEGKKNIFLVADAGAMYAAKAAGLAPRFDIFTPDPSEIAFLADPQATHPAYISKHLFAADADAIPGQIDAAFKYKMAARLLVVKGKVDYIASDGKILARIDKPNIPALEPIGGTGDTITGLVSALVYGGLKPAAAAIIAARTNRMAGELANPTPATPVREIVDQFPTVLAEHLAQWAEELA